MIDVFPKFIIETDDELGDCLIIAKCTYHKQLITDSTKVKGGGWWSKEGNTITLYGSSQELGPAKLEDIKSVIKNKNVYTSRTLIRNISDDFKFMYKYPYGEIIEL